MGGKPRKPVEPLLIEVEDWRLSASVLPDGRKVLAASRRGSLGCEFLSYNDTAGLTTMVDAVYALVRAIAEGAEP